LTKLDRVGGIGRADDARHDAAFAGNRADDSDLGVAGGLPGLAEVRADIAFVNFNHSIKFEHLAAHGRTPAMAHIPACAPIGARVLAEDDPMDLKGTDAFFRGQHQVSDLEPSLQGNLGVLKDRFGDDAKPVPVLLADAALPVPRLEVELVGLGVAAPGAGNAVQPALGDQKSLAGIFVREAGFGMRRKSSCLET